LEVFGDATVIGHGFLMFLPVIGKLVTGFFVVPLNTMGFFKVFLILFLLFTFLFFYFFFPDFKFS